jgi:hypothetical protein
MSRYIPVAEVAKLVRKALKENFAGIKFSVRSSSYSGGASIDVRWLDGPCEPDVTKVVKQFQGATFDSSIDLTSYITHELDGEEVRFGSDYVMTHRDMSRAFVEAIAQQFCVHHGISMLEVKGDEKSAWVNTRSLDYHMDRWLSELLCNTDAKDMHHAYASQDERTQREEETWQRHAADRERKAREQAEKVAREWAEHEERQRKAREEQERQRQEQERARVRRQVSIATRAQALVYLGVSGTVNRTTILQAFRDRVKRASDGKGGYTEDMDLLVKAKEKALQ